MQTVDAPSVYGNHCCRSSDSSITPASLMSCDSNELRKSMDTQLSMIVPTKSASAWLSVLRDRVGRAAVVGSTRISRRSACILYSVRPPFNRRLAEIKTPISHTAGNCKPVSTSRFDQVSNISSKCDLVERAVESNWCGHPRDDALYLYPPPPHRAIARSSGLKR